MISRAFLLALLLSSLSGLAFPAGTPAAATLSAALSSIDSPSSAALTERLDALLETPPLHRAFTGALVVSMRTGRVWYSRNPDRRFVPASNAKLFTTATALNTLDPGRRFSTRVRFQPTLAPGLADPGDSDRSNGIWKGDLILQGGGDPSLTIHDLEELARQVNEAGLRELDGDLLTDATLFTGPGRGPGWGWDWEDEADAAPISALTVNRGRVAVTVTPAEREGEAPTVTFAPPSAGLTADVRARTGPASGKTRLNVSRRHASSVVAISGTISLKGAPDEEEVGVDDSEALAGKVFRSALEHAGVVVRGRSISLSENGEAIPRPPDSSRLLAEHDSAPLGDLIRRMNLPSDNHYAEALIRHVGVAWQASHPDSGEVRLASLADEEDARTTLGRGLAAERSYLDRIGIPDEDAHLVDGSGLSRLDQVTPSAMIRLLQSMARSPRGDLYFNSLPLAGRTGTLRHRMIGTAAEANVRAKTGSLTGVSALTGRLNTRSGEPLLFTLLMNQFPGPTSAVREIQDRFCRILAEQR